MSLPLDEVAHEAPTVKFGQHNELYVICKNKQPLDNICTAIDMEHDVILWDEPNQYFSLKVESTHHKHKLAIL